MYDVILDCNNSIIEKHVDQLGYISIIDNHIYQSNKQHQTKSQIKTEKECQSKNEHKFVIPVNLKQI